MSAMTFPDIHAVADVEDEIAVEVEVNDALERLPIDDEYNYGEDPDMWLYRDRTVAILKRYSRLSIEAGRLPSLLGREFFRGHVSHYQVTTFEGVVIFVHDVETCLAGGLLKRVGDPASASQKTCQGVENDEFLASDCAGSE
jgi:hypothetical protein